MLLFVLLIFLYAILDITLMQRQHAFGLPPSGCESCAPRIQNHHSHGISRCNQLPLPKHSKHMTSLPLIPQDNWDIVQTLERPKNSIIKHNNQNSIQVKLPQHNVPSQFTVYPFRKNLMKPKSQDSLLNDSTECPCPFCQSHWENISICSKTDRSAIYEVRTNSDVFCCACSHKKQFEMKSKQATKTYVCIICKSDASACCGTPQGCNYGCSQQFDYERRENFRSNRCCTKSICCFEKNIRNTTHKALMSSPLPARCSSSETLCSTESCQSDAVFQKAYLRMYVFYSMYAFCILHACYKKHRYPSR